MILVDFAAFDGLSLSRGQRFLVRLLSVHTFQPFRAESRNDACQVYTTLTRIAALINALFYTAVFNLDFVHLLHFRTRSS